MADTLALNCFAMGQSLKHIFTINIRNTATVGALRRDIKAMKTNTFPDWDVNLLALWRVSFSQDELKNELHNFNPTPETELRPTDRLLEVFQTPPAPKHLHIIINSPLLCKYFTLYSVVHRH